MRLYSFAVIALSLVLGAMMPGGAAVLYNFQAGRDGDSPTSGLILDPNGTLFGTTLIGGFNRRNGAGCGTVFSLTPKASAYDERVLHPFKCSVNDGDNPSGVLIEDAAGSLYGTTQGGGFNQCGTPASSLECGTVFTLARAGAKYKERLIYRFQGNGDGADPVAGIMQDPRGMFYGTTLLGGVAGCPEGNVTQCGTVFSLVPGASACAETVLYRFQGPPSDGAHPSGGLVEDGNGSLFGTTSEGGSGRCKAPTRGTAGCGTVFRLTPNGSGYTETVLYNFQGRPDGSAPNSTLLLGSDGTLYGTTQSGGAKACWHHQGCGMVFALTPNGSGGYTEIALYTFGGGKYGSYPSGLIRDGSGNLYGVTMDGGAKCSGDPIFGCGTVFELVPGSWPYTEVILYKFGGADGLWPYGTLAMGPGPTLFGTTLGGGAISNCGACGVAFSVGLNAASRLTF